MRVQRRKNKPGEYKAPEARRRQYTYKVSTEYQWKERQ
jgi:hypothetical protein